MIALQVRGRGFIGMAAYLMNGRSGKEQERVAWHTTRNLPTTDPELAVTFMRATATRNYFVQKPAYQMVLNFAPEDHVDRAIMERVADRVLERLGLAQHQALLVAHSDRCHPHVHIMVCRVHPETGRTWSSWQDWPKATQAIREAEHALGLREVPSPLPSGLSTALAERARALGRGEAGPRLERGGVSGNATDERHQRASPVAAVAQDVRAYERVVDRIREQYRAQVEASGARARIMRLELAAERVGAAQAKIDRSLRKVYRDPERAFGAYRTAAEAHGIAAATHLMRERPEHFGPLQTTSRRHALPLLRTQDDSQARAALPAAATAAREAIEATRALGTVVAELALRRAQGAFARELEMLYLDPEAARSAFDRIAECEGATRTTAIIRERPAALGAVRPTVSGAVARLEEQVGRVAVQAIELLEARAAVTRASTPPSEALEREKALAQAEANRASARDGALRSELQALPERKALERRLRYAVSRLAPGELQRLERSLTAPQVAIARQLRNVAREVALGREEEREQAVSIERL